MNREIKFRAWDDQELRMNYGEFEQFDDSILFRFHHFGMEAEPVYMQWTGMLDKNGKEIYEGDIVHIVNELTTAPGTEPYDAVIEWHGVGFHARDISKPKSWFIIGTPFSFNPLTSQAMDFEIIGNIYENQELIDNAI